MTVWTGNVPLPEAWLRDLGTALSKIDGTSEEHELRKVFDVLLNQLVATALDPSISTAHRGVAINALCSLVGRAATLKIQQPLPESTWFGSLCILLDRSDSVKSKVLRQLLSCLTNSLRTFPQDEAQQILHRATDMILRILLEQSEQVRIKPALQTLTHLLAKDLLGLDKLIAHWRDLRCPAKPQEHRLRPDLAEFQDLLQVLFEWVGVQTTSIVAGQACRALLDKIMRHEVLGSASIDPPWILPLVHVLRENVDDLYNYRLHLLPDLCQSHVPHYRHLLAVLGLETIFGSTKEPGMPEISETDVKILFMCLEVGKENGIVIDSGAREIQVRDNVLHLPDTALSRGLESASDTIRLPALALMISSVSITRPFTPHAIQCLLQNFPHLFMETDLYVRSEVLVYVQRLVDRLKAVTASLSRSAYKGLNRHKEQRPPAPVQETDSSPETAFAMHKKFLRSFLALAKAQLQPAAAYQRHVSGLRTLIILLKSGLDERLPHSQLSKQSQTKESAKWPFHEPIFDVTLSRLLQDLLMDPFEDVRGFAASLLTMQASTPMSIGMVVDQRLLTRAEDLMLSTGRADHADGIARANALAFETADDSGSDVEKSMRSKVLQMDSLVQSLEQRLSLARSDLKSAVRKLPLHGALASIRLVLDSPTFYEQLNTKVEIAWCDFHDQIVKALSEVWLCVRTVLCNDAPEGYMPESMEDDTELTTKDILSFCWRALKEASSLLRVLVTKASVGDSERCSLSQKQFEELLHLAFTQLVELRHRGAFSAVSQAFAACCSKASSLQRDDLLEKLFADTLVSIQDKGTATTRRSAGLPSLVVGILSACPTSALLRHGIESLIAEAKYPVKDNVVHGDSLPQVHALNCIRATLINTTLGQHTESYIAECLSLAGHCLTSNVWAVRNCGLMLFRALIDRLLGSTESQNWSQDTIKVAKTHSPYDEFPELLSIVLGLLKPTPTRLASNQSALESVFPALKLIQRIPPPVSKRTEIRDLVLRLCQSPHWHVRDMAARSYATLISPTKRLQVAQNLIPEHQTSQNLTHGRLLCILHLMRLELRSDTVDSEAILMLEDGLSTSLKHLIEADRSPFCRIVYFDIINMLVSHMLKHQSDVSTSRSIIHVTDVEQVLRVPPTVQRSLGLWALLQYISASDQTDASFSLVSASTEVDLAEYLRLLTAVDARVCLSILEPIVSVAVDVPASSLRIIAGYLSSTASRSDRVDPQILSSSRLLLFQLYEALSKDESVLLDPLRPAVMEASLRDNVDMPPSLLESTILLWGPLLNKSCQYFTTNSAIIEELNSLALTVLPLLDEHQSFNLRIAVARCLASITKLWTQKFGADHDHRIDATRAQYILLIYDLLNDDDEEIRGIATTIATMILSEEGDTTRIQHVVPLLASQRLIAHLQRKYLHIPTVVRAAIARLKGVHRCRSAQQAFASVTADRTSLFAVEKQNLFIDPAREASLWSGLLRELSDVELLSMMETQDFVIWASEGLDLLRRHLDDHVDGALGWTSKPDVFIFGMQIWCAIDVILIWQRQYGTALAIANQMLEDLARLRTVANTQEMHNLWLEEIERILTREIEARAREGAGTPELQLVGEALAPPAPPVSAQ